MRTYRELTAMHASLREIGARLERLESHATDADALTPRRPAP